MSTSTYDYPHFFDETNTKKVVALDDLDPLVNTKAIEVSSDGINLKQDILGTLIDTKLSPTVIQNVVSGDFISFERLILLKQALAAVEIPPNATTFQVNDTIRIDNGSSNNVLSVVGGQATMTSNTNQVLSASGQTIINNTNRLIYLGDGGSQGSEVKAAGYNGTEAEINPRSWFGLFTPNDQEGQVYSTGLEFTPARFRFDHTWGAEWYNFSPLNADFVAFRLVESNGLAMNMGVQRTEWAGAGPVQVNTSGATIARLFSTPFGDRCPIRIQASGYTGRTPGGNGKWTVKIKCWGFGEGPGYSARYSETICSYFVAPTGGNVDYLAQIATSTFNGIGDQGRGWIYDKGNIPMT